MDTATEANRQFTSPATQPAQVLEILTVSGWVHVDAWIFRSWSGARRIDGDAHKGQVYFLGSDKVART
jgi:hypothetical protein